MEAHRMFLLFTFFISAHTDSKCVDEEFKSTLSMILKLELIYKATPPLLLLEGVENNSYPLKFTLLIKLVFIFSDSLTDSYNIKFWVYVNKKFT